MFSQCCRSVLRASWRRSHCTSQFSVMSPLVAGGRRELSILSRYNKPPISVPGAEVSPDQEAKDEDVEAILGDDMELEVPRSSTGAEGWKEADHLSAAMAGATVACVAALSAHVLTLSGPQSWRLAVALMMTP